jgi:hypothetical protein
MQVTREDLQNMYKESLDEDKQELIAGQLDSFDRMIQLINKKGDKLWTQTYFKESPAFLQALSVSLMEKYVDSKITINYKYDNFGYSSITVDWSSPPNK